jgi:hypothetical protein
MPCAEHPCTDVLPTANRKANSTIPVRKQHSEAIDAYSATMGTSQCVVNISSEVYAGQRWGTLSDRAAEPIVIASSTGYTSLHWHLLRLD